MIPAHELGWMAGVIDLRGRIVYKNSALRKKNRQITLVAESKELPVIRRLAQLTGTKPEARNQSALSEFIRKGCREHCPEVHIHVGPEVFLPSISRWTISGAAMVCVLDNLQPFLMVDRGYPEAVEEARANTTLVGQGATATIRSLRRLEALGWDLPDEYAHAVMENPTREVVAA